ncbi:MAG: hypothetical protein WCE58_10865 [Gallionella sp.]
MKLSEIIDFEFQKRNIERINQTAKEETAYANSAQSWLEMKMAEAAAQKARQNFIQAAVASAASRGYHP